MRCVIFVAAIVLLVIAADVTGFEFGDMIYYEPKRMKAKDMCTLFEHKHPVVYVGDLYFPGKNPGENVFERSFFGSQCKFSRLDMSRNPKVCNYLDGYEEKGVSYRKGSVSEMEERIREIMKNCRKYNLYDRHCDPLASLVRYRKQMSLQPGLDLEELCKPRKVTRSRVVAHITSEKAARRLTCDIPLTEPFWG